MWGIAIHLWVAKFVMTKFFMPPVLLSWVNSLQIWRGRNKWNQTISISLSLDSGQYWCTPKTGPSFPKMVTQTNFMLPSPTIFSFLAQNWISLNNYDRDFRKLWAVNIFTIDLYIFQVPWKTTFPSVPLAVDHQQMI